MSAGYEVQDIGDGTFLLLDGICDENDREVALGMARSEIAVIAGLSKVLVEDADPIEFGGLLYVDESGRNRVPLQITPATAKGRTFGELTVLGPAGEVMPRPKSELELWLGAAAANERLRHIARLFALPPDWFTLYKIYEEVRGAVGGEKNLLNKGWASDTRIKQFTQTANSYDAVGDAARHSRAAGFKKPRNGPISLDEGITLVRILVRAWFQECVGRKT
jgi:hypothetical protein